MTFIWPSMLIVLLVIGGAVRLLIPLGIIFGTFVLGLWFFNREAPRIAENL